MHNLKEIRNQTELFKKKLSDRNTNISLNTLIDLDEKNRQLIQKKQKL